MSPKSLYTSAYPTTTTSPYGNDLRKTCGRKHHNSCDNAPSGSIRHAEKMNTESRGPPNAALFRLRLKFRQTDSFSAMPLFQSAVECMDILFSGLLRSDRQDRSKIMFCLPTSHLRKIKQALDR